MSQSSTLKAEPRTRVGKGSARALRREGKIPAVIYGDKQAPLSITVSANEIYHRIYRGHFTTTIVDIEVDGKTIRALPREYQMDPVKDMPLHVDFLRISKGAVVTVEVPVQFINEEQSPGLKRGGVLNVVRHQVEVECPADAIPEHIVVDLTGVDLGDSIHISAVALPKNVTPTITDRDFTIATIAAPAGLKSEEAEQTEDAAEVE
ncbi:50S ribosomal protein L25/general stress protein Ctc [Chelativorans composti]|uniref:Large ribosomal subunit protein bL25 n=1 Tax=Chelativorans composti TaxID=768533 RepID=A0ABW5DH26_9HYPH